MRQRIIATLVAAVVMLGSAKTHGQWYFGNDTIEEKKVPVLGLMDGGTLTFRTATITVGDFYYQSRTARTSVTSGSLIVENFHATTDSFTALNNFINFTGNGMIQNFWLHVENTRIEINDVDNPFGVMPSNYTSPIVLTDTSVQAGNNTVRRGTAWLRNDTNFGVNIGINGTVSDLTMTGGTVNNAGRIDNLTVGGGTYGGTGTVGNLKFQSNSDVFTIAGWRNDDGFGFMDAGTVDLTNANLVLNLSGMFDNSDVRGGADAWVSAFFGTFGSDALSWERLFGTESVGNTDAMNSFSIHRGDEDSMISWTAESGWSGTRLLAFSGAGVTVVPIAAPEPGTLAIIGLGLVGLGLLRRRKVESLQDSD